MSEKETNPKRKSLREMIERTLEFLGEGDNPPFPVLRILAENFSESERGLLEEKGYTVVEVKNIEELLSDGIRSLLLQAQAIQTGKGGESGTRPDLPRKLAIVISPKLRKEAMLREDIDSAGERFRDIWIREAQYMVAIDEENPY
ncbi:MAG: hypothetical protein A3J67_03495 [Parcubacteria group bacterium RIFCSPHIGHO2_02_FULL_48_10b]|nr:MAG: hypothetical protein A3J67_03495 [Parcubacteria group bacterium RIFCSPHIGHO2_02_FULL_48_10b]